LLKKILLIGISFTIIGGLALFSYGCNSKTGQTASQQLVAVQRGNLTIDITGAGNLALAKTEDLAFEIAGYVQDVLVKEGDSVKQDQVVAQLDTSEWEKQLKTLQKALDTAQRSQTSTQSNVTKTQRNLASIQSNVSKTQRAVTTAENNVTRAQSQVTAKELALRQSQLDLETAKYNQGQIEEVHAAQDAVDGAQTLLDVAQANFQIARNQDTATPDMQEDIANYTIVLEKAQQRLQDVIRGNNTNISSTVAIQIAQSQLKVEQATKGLGDAQTAIDDAKLAVLDAQTEVESAKTAVTDAQADVTDAQTAINNALLDQKNADQNVVDAKSDLADAQALSPLVKVPFNGFVTKVNVTGGDEVQKGSIAMTVADPAKFTADIVVGESDITKVKEGGAATVQVDAIAGLTLPAIVTHISPTATVQSGVVSYKVTVEMENSPPARAPQPSETPSPASNPASTPEITRTPNRGGFSRGNLPFSGQPGTAAVTSPTSLIKSGMSVTVSITVAESRNVLLVPNQAIMYSARTSQVQVMKDGKSETRPIKTGINNWLYTEVTDGLSEGEQVVITLENAGSSNPRTTPTIRGGQGPVSLPGGGRVVIR
jgi:HlyD family secretion protein